MAHETVIRSSLLVRDVQNPNTATQKFAVFTGSGNNDLNLLGFRTPTELLSDIGFNEAVDDRVSTLIQAGANISVTYDDDGNALIIAAPNTVTGSGTATQVAFWGTSNSLSGNSNLYWDNTNTRLGVGTNSPSTQLEIQSALNTGAGITGSELLTSSGWTTTGWTGDFFIGFTHSTGNTTPLSNNFSPTIDEYYHISITATGNTTGNYTLSFGGFTPLDPISAAGTTNFGLKATTTDSLTITPTSTYNGTLLISIKVASASTATQSWKNSSGLIVNELRAGNSPTNTLLGLNSGTRLLSGTSNVGIGNETFYNSINPNNSVGVGYQSLSSSDAEGNVAVGYQTLRDNTKGHSNTAIGRASFRATTSGYGNVGVGAYTGVLNTTGFFNVGIGYFAFQANTTGYYNVAIGNRALRSNTVGFSNLAVGQNALFLNTSGSSNTAFGTAALYRNTTGTNNIGIGNNSLDNNDSGGSNIAIGLSAGSLVSAGTANTLSTNSILIGRNTRVAATGQTNQVVIGDQAIGLGTNTTVIGNTGTTQTHLHGNLTLGSTNTPNARLQVQGADTTDTGWTAQFHNSLGTSNSLMIRNDGNVGIGTSGTTARLVVRGSGSSAASNALIVQNSGGTSSFVVQDDGIVRFNTARVISGFMTLQTNGGSNLTGFSFTSVNPFTATSDITSYISGNPRYWPVSGTGTFTYLNVNPSIDQTGGANGITRGIFIQPSLLSAPNWRSIEWNNDSGFGLYGAGSGTNYLNGNLGIKTTTPAQTLHVAGTMRLTGNAGTATEVLGRDANGDLSGIAFSTIVASGGGVSGSGTATQVAFWKSGSTTELTSSSNLYWDDVNNRLGVGTSTPSAKLNTISTSDLNALHQRISNDITSPSIIFRKARGTIASPTVVQQGDLLGSFGFSGLLSDGTTYSNDNSFFGGQVSGPVTSTNLPTSIFFKVGQTATPYLVSFYIHDSGRSRFSSEAISSALPQPRAKLEVIGQTNANTGWTAQFHNNLGNSNSLVIRDDGNVGIGTSGTTARFVVRASGSSSGSTAMLVENSGGTSMLMVREDGRVGIGTASPSKPFHVAGESYFASALQLEGGLKDNRDNVFLSQSLNSVASNRDIILGNGTYARIRLHSKEVSIGGSFPTTSYLFYVDGGTGTGITDRQGIYMRPTQPAAGGNTNGGDIIIELPNGTGTGRKGTVLIGASATTINSALLELVSTDRGFLPPRMTSVERDAIATPATGLQIYNTTLNVMQHYNGTTWVSEAGGSGGTGTVSGSGTATQVAFWKSGSTTELTSSSNLYWDDVNSRLGVGITTPTSNLDVVGTVEFQNPSTDYDGGVLGSELLTSSGWTSAGWTGSFATGYTHTTGNTNVLSNTLSATIGFYYQITYTITGRTAGIVTISFGGLSTTVITSGAFGPRATTTGNLTITPTSDFDGTIAISIKRITPSLSAFIAANSSSTVILEERYQAFNDFRGNEAGKYNTTGVYNLFYGNTAGRNNTTGSYNTFLGGTAGENNTTGTGNFFLGYGTGRLSTNSSYNAFIGYLTGDQASGTYNTFIGTFAGREIVGNNNIAIGGDAGLRIGTGTVSNTLATGSIYLGIDARPLANNQSNQIVIANSGRGLGSNTTVLGNTSTVQTHLHGSLTLGSTTSPAARMVVTGPQPSGTTTWTAQFHNALGNSNSLMIRDDGNVGIGTSTPNFKLTVQANDAGLLVSGANVSPFTQIIASFVYGGNGNTINVENRGGRASFQARATTAVGAAASPLFLNPNGGTVSVNNDNPDASAIFDVRSTTQGFLPPRMTTANRNLISSPATGLQVYNSSLNVMQHYNGVSWVNEANPILTRVSTGTTQVELFLDGVSSRFGLVGTNKVWNFRIQLCAIVASAGTGTLDLSDSYISEHLIGIKRSGSSINVVGGGVVQNLIGANTQMEDSVVTITGDSGTESLRVFYTPPSGAAANTVIRISATLYYTEAGV